MTDSAESTVILYTQPGCGPCVGLSRNLDALGIDYEKRDIRQDETAAQRVAELGYKGTPVVEHPGGHFHGFDPVKVEEMRAVLFRM